MSIIKAADLDLKGFLNNLDLWRGKKEKETIKKNTHVVKLSGIELCLDSLHYD